MQGYCPNCKQTKEMKNIRSVKLVNGQRVTKGQCASCETEIWKKET